MFLRCVCIYSPANVIFYADRIHCAILHIAGDNIKQLKQGCILKLNYGKLKKLYVQAFKVLVLAIFPASFISIIA